MKFLRFALCLLFTAIAAEERQFDIISSSPEQIADLAQEDSSLIGGIVSPLSGQVYLRVTDLVAKGAESIPLHRIYLPPTLRNPITKPQSKTQCFIDEREYNFNLLKEYKGWTLLPHVVLKLVGNQIKLTDPNGATLDFRVVGQNAILISSPHGMSNLAGDVCSGRNDLRNTQVLIEGNEIHVIAPDGTKRFYTRVNLEFFHLAKEILPNGKILRYHYNQPLFPSKIESLDPQGKHVYASLSFNGDMFWDECCSASTHAGDLASYGSRHPKRNLEFKKKNATIRHTLTHHPVLAFANTPNYSDETIGYEEDFALTNFNGKDHVFKCSYKLSSGSIYRINTLSLPVGEEDAFTQLYEITYDPADAGVKGGKTTVTRKDGIKIVYSFFKTLLPEAVEWFYPNGKLAKKKIYEWEDNQRLKRISWKYGDGTLFYSKTYEHDRFGNPKVETLEGNLTGEKGTQQRTIYREFSEDGKHLLLKETYEEGKIFVYTYFKNTNLPASKTTYEGEKFVCQETWEYDDAYNLIQHIKDDKISQKTLTRYILSQNPATLHRPEWIEERYEEGLLQKTQLSYDKRGNVECEKIYDAENKFCYEISRETNAQGNVLWETNPIGQKNKKEYDLRGRLKTYLNFSNRLTQIRTLDKQGRLKKLQEADRTTLYEYDLFDRCTKTIDYLGNITTYEPDPLTGETCSTTGPFKDTILSSYDPFGRRLTYTDPHGNTTSYTYNIYGSETVITHPDEGKEIYFYFTNGDLRSHTNLDGLTIEYDRDIFGRPTNKKYLQKDKTLAQETFVYNAYQLKSQTDSENYTTTYQHDRAGRKTSETAGETVTFYDYGPLGQLAFISHSDLFYTHFQRDWLDRVLEERKTDANDKVVWKKKYTYDPDGNQQTVTTYPNNIAAQETFHHDPFGRQTLYIDAEGFQTTTSYTPEKNQLIKTIIDPNGIKTIFKYDAYGRETFQQIGSDYSKIQTYDLAGNLSQIQEGETVTQYSYDNCNRVKTLTRAFGTPDARTTTYEYKKTNRIASKTTPDGLILTYTYSPFGDLSTLSSSDGKLLQTFRHNLNGELVFADDSGHTIDRTLDRFGNILQETIDQKLTLKKTYDPLSRLTTITLPDGGLITYDYETIHLKTIGRYSPAGEKLFSHTYEAYDLSCRPLEQKLIHNLGSAAHSYYPSGRPASFQTPFFEQTLTYEPNGRIKTISSDGTYTYTDLSELKTEPNHAYAYDHHHNLTQIDGQTIPHNHLDELTSSQIQYDLRGNLTQNRSSIYTYDPLNRLIQASNPDTIATFTYDALGRCLSKTTRDNTEFYLYHRTEELASFHPNGALKDLKVPGLFLKPVAIELQGLAFAPILDYRGNVRRLIAPTGAIADSYSYTAFGAALSPAATANPWRYSAKRFDPALNLYYFGKRFYDPTLSRWLTTDPAGFVDGTNLYAYVLNNPLMYLDPDGRFAFAVPLLIWGFEVVFPSVATLVISAVSIASVGVAAWAGPKIIDKLNQEFSTAGTGAGLATTDYHAQDIKLPSISWKNTEVYAPDRPLPLTEDGIPIPEADVPHTELGTRDGAKGKYPQAREFDAQGRPVKDIDFTDHGYPKNHPNPHQHRPKPNPTGGTPQRGKPEPVPEWSY